MAKFSARGSFGKPLVWCLNLLHRGHFWKLIMAWTLKDCSVPQEPLDPSKPGTRRPRTRMTQAFHLLFSLLLDPFTILEDLSLS